MKEGVHSVRYFEEDVIEDRYPGPSTIKGCVITIGWLDEYTQTVNRRRIYTTRERGLQAELTGR